MRNYALFLVGLFLPYSLLAQAPEPSLIGYWEGAFIRDGSIQVVKMDIAHGQGGLHALVEVPELGLIGQRQSLTYEEGRLSFRSAYGQAALAVDEAGGEMRGTISRNGTVAMTMHLKRILKPATRSVQIEEVRFRSASVQLAGTLVLPATSGPHPAIVLVHGRGYGSREGNLSPARYLAQRGIAALAFDGRGSGASEGDRATVTDEDRYDDIYGALDLLTSRGDIRADQVGLWSNSAGGWVAPAVAQKTGQVAFLIMSVGPAESLADQQGHVIEYKMRYDDVSFTEADYQAAFAYQKRLVELSKEGASWEAFAPLVAEARAQRWGPYVDLPEDLNNSELDYFRRRPSFDPVAALQQTTIPVLALYGERDYVVPPQENVPKLERYLNEAGNQDFKIVVFPEVGHSLRLGGRMEEEEGKSVFRWPRYPAGYYELIFGWLDERLDLPD